MAKKLVIHSSGKKYVVEDDKDFHSNFGLIKKADLQKDEATSNKGDTFQILDPTFTDLYQKIKRQAQIIPLKDVGMIITFCGIGKNTVVVDAGAGSGGLSLLLANIAKKVTTYDIRKDHLDIVKKNIELLNLKNMEAKDGSIYEGVKEKNADVLTLDVPEPWKAIDSAKTVLKKGGFIVSYSPTIPQVADFVNAIHETKEFTHLHTFEIIQREWEIRGRKVRPTTPPVGHSGFLSFIRKVA